MPVGRGPHDNGRLRRALLVLLLPVAACSPASTVPAAGIPPAPTSVSQLLRAAAVREEQAITQTGAYVDAEQLGYVVKPGVIFEAIPRPGSYCLDASLDATSQRYRLDGDKGGAIEPGACQRPRP